MIYMSDFVAYYYVSVSSVFNLECSVQQVDLEQYRCIMPLLCIIGCADSA